MAITYKLNNSLYVNLTNRCLMACTYCIKYKWKGKFYGEDLRLPAEPSAKEVIREIKDPKKYDEIIFCGYGEPLIKLDVLKEVAAWVHARGGRVRINTSGHANVFHKRNIVPELKGLVDAISVSLNATSPRQYNRLNRPKQKTNAFNQTIVFIAECKKYISDVTVTVVGLQGVDVEKVRAIAKKLGVAFRVRPLLD
jgi:TatD DNase family protein